MTRALYLSLFVGLFLVLGLLSSHAQDKKSKKADPSFVQGEVLVKFKPKTPKRFILALKESLKVKEETYTSSIELYHWKGDFDTPQAIYKLKKSSHVLYAEPNFKVGIQNK